MRAAAGNEPGRAHTGKGKKTPDRTSHGKLEFGGKPARGSLLGATELAGGADALVPPADFSAIDR